MALALIPAVHSLARRGDAWIQGGLFDGAEMFSLVLNMIMGYWPAACPLVMATEAGRSAVLNAFTRFEVRERGQCSETLRPVFFLSGPRNKKYLSCKSCGESAVAQEGHLCSGLFQDPEIRNILSTLAAYNPSSTAVAVALARTGLLTGLARWGEVNCGALLASQVKDKEDFTQVGASLACTFCSHGSPFPLTCRTYRTCLCSRHCLPSLSSQSKLAWAPAGNTRARVTGPPSAARPSGSGCRQR